MNQLILFILTYTVSMSSLAFSVTDIVPVPDTFVTDVLTADLSDTECLALNIYHESRGESVDGQRLVAQTTMNRVRHHGFKDTVCGVVRQDKQFSWTHDGKIDHAYDREAYQQAYFIAFGFTKLGYNVPGEYSRLILNYHALSVAPHWPTLHALFVQDNHVFYVRNRDLNAYNHFKPLFDTYTRHENKMEHLA